MADRLANADLICVGLLGSARGLKGELRVKSFTADASAIASYGPLTDETGARTFELKVTGKHKDQLVVRIKGVNDRNAAEALNGTKLYMHRDRLPETEEDEFYFSDLQGLDAELVDGTPFGQVVEAEDFGGGPFIEVKTPGHGRVLVPFTKAAVPVVDLKARRVVIDPPDGLLEPGDPEPQDGEEA
ncbi:ribosome maturation factor RimM [Magnetovibrio sp.]|uniref:ribosome maturation factor RimM n=1 Tax=Magnetovibrio sp. TaxID=2024836 RepID=UPI002F92CAE0